jgi:2-hydroxy-6-oxonona-2,4-dienedioate hydrolase
MTDNTKLSEKEDTIGETTIHYHVSKYHNAKNIILVHGIGLSSRYMLPLAEELSNKYTVYAIDLPGFGKSGRPSGKYELEVLATSLRGFIEQNGIASPVLIGNSFGCQVIIKYLKRYATNTPAILIGPTMNVFERSYIMQMIRWLQNLKNEPTKKLSWILIKDIVGSGVVRVFKAFDLGIKDKPEDGLDRLNNRILFLRGELDPIVPMRWLKFLANKNKSFSVSELPNAGHALNYSSPKPLANIIDKFITN